MLQTPSLETARRSAEALAPLEPVGAVAASIARYLEGSDGAEAGKVLVYIASSEARRRAIAAMLDALLEPGRTASFPAVEGHPGDGIPPSAATMGRRMATLRWLMDRNHLPAVVVTTPSALIRRVPPEDALRGRHIEVRVGEAIAAKSIERDLLALGYRCDERVDEPGEFALRGRVVEVFPAAAPRPCRIEHDGGRVTAIRSYDDASQRSVAESRLLVVDPASEILPCPAERDEAFFLCRHYAQPATFFDHLPACQVILEDGADRRAEEIFALLADLPLDERAAHAVRSDHMTVADWSRTIGTRLRATMNAGTQPAQVPLFALDRHPYRSMADFAAPLVRDGYRIVIAGTHRRELAAAAGRAARALACESRTVPSWNDVLAAEAGSLLAVEMPVTEGFVAHADAVAVIALRDLAGQRADGGWNDQPELFAEGDEVFGLGDVVVHLDHGLAVVEGLEPIADGEALCLRYANDETLLVPMSDIGALWRYGGPASEVKLDRLKGRQWLKRRDGIMTEIAGTAERMVSLLKAREEARAPVLSPDRARFERFCARFPYELTRDQARASAAVLDDLASGLPMARLVCGDVGYGKTEVALRAAAAAVFAGRQVAVVAPTTVLAQQHYRTFAERFGPQGVQVARLSRLVGADEAEATRSGLADGTVRVVVGSHAVLSDDVMFKDLALVIIDEEQRFGAAQKARMHGLAASLHVLTMTATPIPRTLQAGFVGLFDVSIVASPPTGRRPVRTCVCAFDDARAVEALRAEKLAGGQSFVVCPRIEDLDAMHRRLRAAAPELDVALLHGQMASEEIDDAMLAFAEGTGDVLLATAILESGLDVPRANTMIVWRPDRFGLAQLHQLRGRVGRGLRRGTAIFATDPEEALGEEARKRLAALEELSALGAGFAIAGRDLDLRGTGELLGEEQAGHLQTIGIGLYRQTLERALALARGADPAEDWQPVIQLGAATAIPADYVPEPDLRIELAILLQRIDDAAGLTALQAEIEDRFGTLPDALETLFATATLKLRCRPLGVRSLKGGPKGIAAEFAGADLERVKRSPLPGTADLRLSGSRLIFDCTTASAPERLQAAAALLERLEAAVDDAAA